ncbi:hypothetical protein ACIRYZ_23330 [Kitasatospora sp. NPDC101155]|uniref:hypothetical protein n=1 Tax=Kitasatospora sp. NPDC101155 TaxID=3364097 RepID=UPI003822FF1A
MKWPKADAADNHERIIATTREALAAEGVDLPMREIARRAGLGIATLDTAGPRVLCAAPLTAAGQRPGRRPSGAHAREPDPLRPSGRLDHVAGAIGSAPPIP